MLVLAYWLAPIGAKFLRFDFVELNLQRYLRGITGEAEPSKRSSFELSRAIAKSTNLTFNKLTLPIGPTI